MVDADRFEEMRQRLQARVKPSRYAHSMGVSQAAEQLARIYGVNENDAAVAGLLHDWDKALSFKQLRKLAKKHTKVPKAVRKNIPGVLHAYTAPYSLKKEFPELTDEVLQAIERHTCAAPEMADLDMVVFIADIIEPGRTFGDVAPLREAVGEVSLEELFYMTYKATMIYLLEDDKAIHPDSLITWNAWVAKREASESGCFGSACAEGAGDTGEGQKAADFQAATADPASDTASDAATDRADAASGAASDEAVGATDRETAAPGADSKPEADGSSADVPEAASVRNVRPNGARIITIE